MARVCRGGVSLGLRLRRLLFVRLVEKSARVDGGVLLGVRGGGCARRSGSGLWSWRGGRFVVLLTLLVFEELGWE
jgi:hypothetical protein